VRETLEVCVDRSLDGKQSVDKQDEQTSGNHEAESRVLQHIIVETGMGKGVEEYGNMGDVSMLQIAVDRLHNLLPDASIEVLTDSAENLKRFCPAALALENRGRALWFSNVVLPRRVGELVPEWSVGIFGWLKKAIRWRYPGLLKTILVRRYQGQDRSTDAKSVEAFAAALERADLVLICGAGGFYNGCQTWSMEILDLIETAIRRKMPVAMLGQGFGPLSDPLILKRAASILPHVEFITLRGGRESRPILRSLGVPESKIRTTGDEAVELAYAARTAEPGIGLGVGLRFGASATVDDDEVKSLRSVLQGFARAHSVSLIALPIAIQNYTRDDLAIKRVLSGFDDESDGGKTLGSPLKVIKQAARCRVVVTGAYHAAVFALAQGIPVVSLAKSAYFAGKLIGLEDQFGEGCQTIQLTETGWPERLNRAIENAWRRADDLREPLQAAALRQIELTRDSYGQVKRLLEETHEQKEGIPARRFLRT